MFDFNYVYQCITLIANIFNYLLLKIIQVVYFENTRRNKSNISYVNICMYMLVEKMIKVGQMNSILSQNYVIYFGTEKVLIIIIIK
jgi:hypothetical protein